MFGKLLKHEIRHSGRYNLMIYIAAAVITALIGVSLIFGLTAGGMLGCFALVITGYATIIITMVSIIKNFYDSVFSRQGYLTLTLPVKGSALLFSKILVAILWVVVSYIIMGLSFVIVFYYASKSTGASSESLLGMIDSMGLMELLPSGKVMFAAAAVMSVLAISQIVIYIGYIYFTVAVANTRAFQSHPKLYGGMVLLALVAVISRLKQFVNEYIPISFNITTDKAYFAFSPVETMGGMDISATLFEAIVAVGLLVLTGYIIEHKVNLK